MTGPTSWRSASSLTVSEAADVLGVSRSQGYEMAATGVLQTYRDRHGRQRVRPVDLEPMLTPAPGPEPDLFSGTSSVTEDLAVWLASKADPDGVIRDPEAVALIQEALTDG